MISKTQTTELKGISVLLLLVHHYFYDFKGTDGILMDYIVDYSKICVTLFVFLSGYGLYKSYKNSNCKYFQFTASRIKKVMVRYQMVFILFALIGTVSGLRTLEQAYGTSNVFLKMFVEFAGLRNYFLHALGDFAYNVTWWFIPMLLLLYVLFVPLVKVLEKHGLKALLGIWIICKLVIPITCPSVVRNMLSSHYVFAFAAAIFLSIYESKIKFFIKENSWTNIIVLFLAATPLLFLSKRVGLANSFWFLSLFIVLVYIAIDEKIKLGILKKTLFHFGKYSYEIYLTHTFIFLYFFPKFSFYFDNKILVLLQGIILSFALGFVVSKTLNGIYIFANKIKTSRLKPSNDADA